MEKQLQLMNLFMDLSDELTWTNKPKLEAEFKGYTLNEINLIEKISLIENANVTKLAAAMHMTRGAISKLANRLILRQLIESYKNPKNKKETYFRLTKTGEKINERHQHFYYEILSRDQVVFEKLSTEAFETIYQFLDCYKQHLHNIQK